MAVLPTIEELSALSLAEIEALVRTNLPPGHTLEFELEEGQVWTAQILDAEAYGVFVTSYPDQRLALLNAYGFVWRQQYKPVNPVWQRRRDDLRETARRGVMHVPGAEAIPDPGDLDPSSVYDLDPTRRTK